ncbi:hypothetical protein [Chitinophaga nivalis]|uniref:Uncharacterized protein n=1 Tax=Chitinophaga nivalis TaxID=2991709 RepID=A0ABT3IEA2_9BACT|nr:hypothetical protein [Chitinophaga nivalis]MCW3468030.1 hypothetical protein [Chitinophaga nivalis]MCW3482279.1 hypothetical protein [Chitinophaga nivalis]
MTYYNGNALYDYLSAGQLPQFRFVTGNAWQLVYGDHNCHPLALIFAAGVPAQQLDSPPASQEKADYALLQTVGDRAGLPVRYIRFACDIAQVETVKVSDHSFVYETRTMPQLSALFGAWGLPVSGTPTAKYLNDQTSSAYHNWQRSSLGGNLTVSDIDLWKLDTTGQPRVIFELKRSYYELERWQPFTDDYRNFTLLSNLCNQAGLQFKIIYNQRTKAPFADKIDRLKIFAVNFAVNPPVVEKGIIALNELENI